MRLGKRLKKSSFWKKAGTAGRPKKPRHVSRDSVVGRVNPDLITSFYTPLFLDLAGETLEQYADDLMQYEELLAVYEQQQQHEEVDVEYNANETEQGQAQDQVQAQVEVDGTIQSTTATTTTASPLPPVEPTPPLFRSQYRIDEFAQLLADTSDHFFAKTGGWRVHANAAKFERMLDEKYGIFRPFITNHPEIEQFVRQMQRKYAMGDFSPIRSKPPIPRSTSIILLFLMQRGKVQWEVLTLAFLFLLVGLQPWALVACVAVGHAMFMRRKARPVGRRMKESARQSVQAYYRRSNVTDYAGYDDGTAGVKETAPDDATREQKQEEKYKILNRPVGAPLKDNEKLDTSTYDTIVLGSGAPCLFAAALLSRAGRRVLVLCPDSADASECIVLEHPNDDRFRNVPFDIGASNNMSRISRQQKLLAPALCTDHDCQGGIRFAKIGSKADGHAFEILSVPGVGTDRANQQAPFVLKADGGVNALMEDAAAYLGDGWPGMDGSVGHSNTGTYVKACEQMNASAGEYYLGKVLPESTAKYRSTAMYQTAASKYAESIMNQYFPLNTHARSLMAAVGVKNESLRPSKASMAVHITNVCAAVSGEGMHYPVGGPRALCHALATVVEQLGGRIVTNAAIAELLFAEEVGVAETQSVVATSGTGTDTGKESTLPPPTCVGVKLATGAEIRFAQDRFEDAADSEKPAVISMLPFITTFIRVFPSYIRTKYGCPRGLGSLAEQRPVFKFIFALDGSANDLSLTGADYYRVPSAALAVDEMDPTTNKVKHGEIGWVDLDEKNLSANDTSDSTRAIDSQSVDEQKRRMSHQKRFERGVSWIHVSFPSAKDPSFAARYGDISTCVVTIEADDDFAIDMGSKPRIFQTKKTSAGVIEDLKRLQERIQADLIDIFPQLEGRFPSFSFIGRFPYASFSHRYFCFLLLANATRNDQTSARRWTSLERDEPYS